MKKSLFPILWMFITFCTPLWAQIPSDGLVAWYPFNGNANDESGNGNHGTVNGATLTADRNGNANSAYHFNGISQYISMLAPDFFVNGNSDFSISMWMKPETNYPGGRYLLSHARVEFLKWGFATVGENCKFTTNLLCSSGNTPFFSNAVSILNTWKFVCLNYNNGSLDLYVDGVYLNSQTLQPIDFILCSTELMYLGFDIVGNPEYWKGDLDDLYFNDRSLSPSEIQQLYTTTSTAVGCNLGQIASVPTSICSGESMTLNATPGQSTQSNCFAPAVKSIGNAPQGSHKVVTDAQGNYYATGTFTGSITLGNTTLTSSGNRDAFLVKYNSCGVVQWAIKGGSSGEQDYPYSMAVDASGNVYWVGRYNQTFTINGTTGSFTAPYTSTSNGNHQDGFLVKLDSNGGIVWGASCRGTSNDGFNGIALDNSGNPIVTGGFNGCCPSSFAVTIYGPNGTVGISSFGSNYGSGLIVKFDANGNILWKGSIYNRDTGLGSIAVDNNDNIYLTTSFRSWSNGTAAQFIDANNATYSIFNPGIGLGCLIKLNANGVYQWGQSFGNVGDGVGSLTSGTDVAIDANGNPWICGYYKGNAAVFYSTNNQNLELPAAATYRGFLAQYSAAGVPLQVVGHERSTGDTYFYGLARGNGKWGVVGTFSGQTNGGLDAMLVEFNDNLTVANAENTGSSGDDSWNTVVYNGTDFVLWGGMGGAATIANESVASASAVLWNRGGGSVVSNNNYTWSTGESNTSVTVSPTQTTTYTCTFSDGTNSCSDEVTVTVLPNVTNTINATIIEGQSYSLGTQTLTTAGTYTEVFTSAAGCDSTVTLTLVVEPLLTCEITAPITTLCEGESLDLSIANQGSVELPGEALVFGPWSAYEYTFNAPVQDWQNQLGGWEIGQAPFSNDVPQLPQEFMSNTFWPEDGYDGYDVFLRKNFTLNQSYDLNQLYLDFGIDNGIAIWVNGFLVTEFNEEGYTFRWEHTVQIPSEYVSYGANIVAIALEDHGGGTAFDMQLRGFRNNVFGEIAWSTGATTPTITVSPTQTTTYSATVTTATQTCTDSITITVNPLLTWYADADADGFGEPNSTVEGCDQPAGFVADNTDCNDADPTVFPNAEEICFDGMDNNCDGVVDENCAIFGCTNPEACNFNADANAEDGSCILLQLYFNCDGNCINDTDGDGVCDELEVSGCTDSTAFNFNPQATNDEGTCEEVLTCEITAPTTTLCEGEFVTLSLNTTGGAGASSQLPANLQQGLVAYYPFNGNANDESGNGNNGVVNGATLTSDRNGLLNSCFDFNGIDSHILVPHSSDFNFQSENKFTFSYWINPSSLSQDQLSLILSKQDGQGISQDGFNSNIEVNSESNFRIMNGPSSGVLALGTPVNSIQIANWCNVTQVFNGNMAFIYLDGILMASTSNSAVVGDNLSDLLIGKPNWQVYNVKNFDGKIDDVFIYNRALSPSEIQQLYSAQSYAWSTNATTPTISVSPNQTTTYTATVTTATQTCTDEITITVNPLLTWYADADGDGFGNAASSTQACDQPSGFVADNTDCDDANNTVYPGAEEICFNQMDNNCNGQIDENCAIYGCINPDACNFNPEANTDDGSCILPQPEICDELDNDCDGLVNEGLIPSDLNSTPVITAVYPVCTTGNLFPANLNNGVNSAVIEGNGPDLWYRLTAQYNTLRVGLTAATGDNSILLYQDMNGCLMLISEEHEVTSGNQILLTDGLVTGETYYIAVHQNAAPTNPSAKVCFTHLLPSICDHAYSANTGIYGNVCRSFKAEFRGNALHYIFNIQSATESGQDLGITPWSYTTTTSSTIVTRLGTLLPANFGSNPKIYTLDIPVVYGLYDAANQLNTLTAQATQTCTITLLPESAVSLRSTDRCPAIKAINQSIATDRSICGAQRYEWELTQVMPTVQAPITVLGGLNTNFLFLNTVPGMANGKTYNVRVRPIHSTGEVGEYGSLQCMKTTGAGLILEDQSGTSAEETTLLSLSGGGEMYVLFPNPTLDGQVTLMWKEHQEGQKEMVLRDVQGRVVWQQKVVIEGNVLELDWKTLDTGIYLLEVDGETVRVVKG